MQYHSVLALLVDLLSIKYFYLNAVFSKIHVHVKQLILQVSFQEVIHVSQLRLIFLFLLLSLYFNIFHWLVLRMHMEKLTTFNSQFPQK